MPKNNPKYWLGGILLVVLITYAPSFSAEFLKWDDSPFIEQNPFIRSLSWDNIQFIFSNSIEGYHPLSVLSLAVEYQLAGGEVSSALVHFDNILLHMANVFLVYVFLFRLTKEWKIALITAAFFAFNPVHVQTVSQAAERRGLLMGLFFLLSLIQYLKYIDKKHWKYFAYAVLFFGLSILSNGRAVSLAIVLIVIDFVLRRSLNWKIVLEKLPFLAIAMGAGFLNIQMQKATGYAYNMTEFMEKTGFVYDMANYTSFDYVIVAGSSFTQYIQNFIFPVNLSSGYPFPVKVDGVLPTIDYVYFAITVLIGVGTIILLIKNRKLAFGILFYAVNIVLLLRLVRSLTENSMEDHYSYIPSIGIFFIIAMLGTKYLKQTWIPMVVVLCISSAFVTNQRAKVWQKNVTFFDDILSKQPNRYTPLINRGLIRVNAHKYDEAILDLDKAIKLMPKYHRAYQVRAKAYEGKGGNADLKAAIKDYTTHIKLSPMAHGNAKAAAILDQVAESYINRGVIKGHLLDYRGAIDDFGFVIGLRPGPDAYTNRAIAYIKLDKLDSARTDLDSALSMVPNYNAAVQTEGFLKQAELLLPENLPKLHAQGVDLLKEKRFEASIKIFNQVIKVNPNYANAYFNRATALFYLRRKEDAQKDADKLKELDPALYEQLDILK